MFLRGALSTTAGPWEPDAIGGASAKRAPVPTTFADLPLLASLQATLSKHALVTLTEIQALALPAMLERRSVVAIAETGSGKTLTYLLPIFDQLKRKEEDGNRVEVESEPRALVIVPTRELGEQVMRVFKSFAHDTRLRVRGILGGQKLRQNRESVAGCFEVLVATPGRLERLVQSGQLHLEAIRILVLDEADQLMDLGFLPQVAALVGACPSRRQLALFSATMSASVQEVAGRLFSEAAVIETSGRQKVVPSLRTRHVPVPDGRRFDVLRRILEEPSSGGTMLFANTRAQCEALGTQLQAAGFSVVVHRGESDPVARRRTLKAFRDGEIALLISTDLGARGLDIEHVARVINGHLPRELDAYLHRVGRTARAGKAGLVVNLVTPRDGPLLALLDDGSTAPEPVKLDPTGRRGPR